MAMATCRMPTLSSTCSVRSISVQRPDGGQTVRPGVIADVDPLPAAKISARVIIDARSEQGASQLSAPRYEGTRRRGPISSRAWRGALYLTLAATRGIAVFMSGTKVS